MLEGCTSEPLFDASLNETSYQCDLCQKNYSRRDLRDRHRRRCAKSINKPQSKRKACSSCAQKKLRCCFSRPACARCMATQRECHYSETNSTNSSDASPIIASTSMSIEGGVKNYNLSRKQSLEPTPFARQSQNELQQWAFSLPSSPDDISFQQAYYDTSLAVPTLASPSEFGTDSPEQSKQLEQLYWASDLMEAAPTLSFGSSLKSGFECSNTGSVAMPAFGPYQSGSFTSPSQFETRKDAFDQFGVGDLDSGLKSCFGSSPIEGIPTELPSDEALRQQLLQLPELAQVRLENPEDIARVLYGFVCQYLQKDFLSPFIHPHWFKMFAEDAAEPLGIAITCISAYVNSVPSSYKFVDQTINVQRDRLIRDFRTALQTREASLATLHAFCIYQIIGLYGEVPPLEPAVQGGRNLPSQNKRREESHLAAELHMSYLIKMTQDLCKIHKSLLIETETSSKSEEWSQWIFIESLRRNIFLVHIINVLASKTYQLNEGFFEPLDNELILHMPLPAPEAAWRAATEQEWRTALMGSQSSRFSKLGLPDDMEKQTPHTLYRWLSSGRKLELDGLVSTPLLTKAVFACAKI